MLRRTWTDATFAGGSFSSSAMRRKPMTISRRLCAARRASRRANILWALPRCISTRRRRTKRVSRKPPHASLAQLHIAAGDADLALDEPGKSLKFRPDDETALSVSGAARLKKGELDQALELFKRVQSNNPKSPSAALNVAAVYMVKKQYGEALKNYEQSFTLAPDNLEALSAIAQIHLLEGNSKAAFARVE